MKFGISKIVAAGVALATSASAFAETTGPDLSSLTSGINVGTVITAVLAVGATMVGLHLAIKGAKTVLSMVKSG